MTFKFSLDGIWQSQQLIRSQIHKEVKKDGIYIIIIWLPIYFFTCLSCSIFLKLGLCFVGYISRFSDFLSCLNVYRFFSLLPEGNEVYNRVYLCALSLAFLLRWTYNAYHFITEQKKKKDLSITIIFNSYVFDLYYIFHQWLKKSVTTIGLFEFCFELYLQCITITK